MARALELLEHRPPGERFAHPVLFLHGAFAGAWAWEEYFLPHFAAAGFHAYALSFSGHGASPGADALDRLSVEDYVEDVVAAVERIGAAPVVIAHSMGGMVAQKYLERARLPGLALLASTPPQGLLPVMSQLALRRPRLFSEMNSLFFQGRASRELVRDILFAGPVDAARLERYCRLLQRESTRVVWDMSFFALPQPWRMRVPPLLVLGGERDELVPPPLVELGARSYGARAEIYPGMGHAMMLERGWQAVADRIIGWLRSLAAGRPAAAAHRA